MNFSEPKTKKLKMEESNDLTSYLEQYPFQFNFQHKRMATTFIEFLSDPLIYSPRPEYIDNFYIEDDTALIAAIRAQNKPAVVSLLLAGCNPNLHNKKGVMPISAAAHKGDTSIMELLIRKGAQVDSLNFSGSTALIQAAHFGHFDAVLLLLRYGGDPDKANSKGTTALMRAAQEGHEEIARILIKAKANVNRKNHEGMNALMLASQRGHAGVVLELIENGAVTDEQTSQGSTALMLSCKRGHERVVDVLVSMGAEICMKDCRSRTAKDTAERRHHLNLLRLLDTQYQITCIQNHERKERTQLLTTFRKAASAGKLQFSRDLIILDSLITSLKKIQRNSNNLDYTYRVEDIIQVASEWSSTSSLPKLQKKTSNNTTITTKSSITSSTTTITTSLPILSSSLSSQTSSYKDGTRLFEEIIEGPVEKIVEGGGILNLCRNITTALTHSMNPPELPTGMCHKAPGNADWYWPFTLMRCLSLPDGVFEMIVDYIPSPRVWKWSLNRLKRRIMISPHISVNDTSILIDEMLTDLNLFDNPIQRGHLMTISNNTEYRKSLVNKLYVPEVLVESLTRWSDVQSISFRMTEADITFKSTVAKRYLALAITLYRMLKFVNDPTRLLTLPKMLMQPPPTILFSKKDQKVDIFQVGIHKLNSLSPRFNSTNTSLPTSTSTPLSTEGLINRNNNNNNNNKLTINNNNNNNYNNNKTLLSTSNVHLLQHSQISNITIDDLFLDEGVLQQMLYDGIQQSNADTLDEDDSLNEFGGGLTNDHDTETELPADGGAYVGSDDDEDDN